MPNWSFIGVEVVVGLVFVVGFVAYALRRATARSPQGILKRLRQGDGRLDLAVGARDSTWDPSRPLGIANARWGRARATYTLVDGDTVHLRYQPRTGPAQDLHGPVPDIPQRPSTMLRIIVVGYTSTLLVGFVVGYAVGHGPTGERLVWGAGGLLAAMALTWVLGLVAAVGKAIHAVRRHAHTPADW